MREYSYYNDIKSITRKAILFKDGYEFFLKNVEKNGVNKME